MKKSFFLLILSVTLLLSSCFGEEAERELIWPSDAYDFMQGVPQFAGEQYDAVVNEDFETVSIYYKEATIEQVYLYIEQLKAFGLEENVSTGIKDGKLHWLSKLEDGKLFAEIMWYDMEYELESGEYTYSLVIKFAEF